MFRDVISPRDEKRPLGRGLSGRVRVDLGELGDPQLPDVVSSIPQLLERPDDWLSQARGRFTRRAPMLDALSAPVFPQRAR